MADQLLWEPSHTDHNNALLNRYSGVQTYYIKADQQVILLDLRMVLTKAVCCTLCVCVGGGEGEHMPLEPPLLPLDPLFQHHWS